MAKRKFRPSPEEREFADFVTRQMEQITTPQERLQAYHRIGTEVLEQIPERAARLEKCKTSTILPVTCSWARTATTPWTART